MDNFAEITFNQDPTMQSRHEAWLSKPPMGVTLGMSIEELLAPGKNRKSGSKKPPRPQQSYILFRKNFRALHWTMKFEDVSTFSRMEWNNAAPVVREFFEMLSGEAKKRHAIKYPNYKYEPRRNDIFRDDGERPLQRRRRRQPPSTGSRLIEQESSPETFPQTENNVDFESFFVADNMTFYGASTFAVDDGEQPDSSISPTTSATDEFAPLMPHDDDDGLFFFDFDFYTNDDGQ